MFLDCKGVLSKVNDYTINYIICVRVYEGYILTQCVTRPHVRHSTHLMLRNSLDVRMIISSVQKYFLSKINKIFFKCLQ